MTLENIHSYEFDNFVLDLPSRRLIDPEGNTLNINARAFDTLLMLVSHQGKTLSKKEIIEHVWADTVVEENNLNQAVFSLRRSFHKSSTDNNFIKTVSGRGYCFITEVKTHIGKDNKSNSIDQPISTLSTLFQFCISNFPRLTVTSTALAILFLGLGFWLIPGLFTTEKQSNDVNTTSLIENAPESSSQGNLSEELGHILPDSVAIQPFTNLNTAPGDLLFAISLHDEVVNQLTKIESLNVISGAPILDLAEKGEISMLELGNRLQVESVLVGNIMYSGQQAHVSLVLKDPRLGVSLWASTYEIELADLNDLLVSKNDIATNVAKALEAEIAPQEQEALDTITTESYEAYRFYLAAKRAYDNYDISNTLILSNKALAQDPNYTDALFYNVLAHAFLSATPAEGMNAQSHINQLFTGAERLFTLEPNKKRSYRAMMISLIAAKRWTAIPPLIAEFRESTNISDREFHELNIGTFYLAVGNFEEAISIYEARLNNEPLNLNTLGQLSAAYEAAGFPQKSDESYALGKMLETPWFGENLRPLISLGRHEPLIDYQNLPVSPLLIDAFNNIHDLTYLKRNLEEFESLENKQPVEYLYYSSLAAYIGEYDLSLRYLEESSNKISMSAHYVWLPIFNGVRESEGFPAYLTRLGLSEYWEHYGLPSFCSNNQTTVTCSVQSREDHSLTSSGASLSRR